MILAKETFKKFGYWPKDLLPKSNKKVIDKCDGCRKLSIRSKSDVTLRGSFCHRCGLRNRAKSLAGKTFGTITVLNRIKYFNGHRFYKTKCKCGIIKYRKHAYLAHSPVKTCSYSCPFSLGYKGIGDLSGRYWSSIKWGAKNRGIKFGLSKLEAFKQFNKQKGICALSGDAIKLIKNAKNKVTQTASLDRKDSSKGYIEGNVQWVHKDHNRAKGSKSDYEYYLQSLAVVNHYNRSKK